MSDDLSPRERRRQQAKATKTVDVKGAAGSALKKATPLIIILAIAGFVAGGFWLQQNQAENAECPGHWHSTFRFYVDGDFVTTFDNYNLDTGTLPGSNHLHRADTEKYMVHFEPRISRCIPFEDFLRDADVHMTKDRISFEGMHEDAPWGGSHTASGNKTLQAFHDTGSGWESISIGKLNDRQLHNYEKVLVLYGDYSDEQIAAYQEQVPDVPDNPSDVMQP